MGRDTIIIPGYAQVVGNKVSVSQAVTHPPEQPQILLLSNQMLSKFQRPDHYFYCWSMTGYTLRNYINDIQDQLIDMDLDRIMVFLGTMQLGIFNAQLVKKEIYDFLSTIWEFNPQASVTCTGLLPRPVDLQRSYHKCTEYNKLYQKCTQELRSKYGWNCHYLDASSDFLKKMGTSKMLNRTLWNNCIYQLQA